MKLHQLGFNLPTRLIDSLDHELGDHRSADNQIVGLKYFCVFHMFLKIIDDFRYETSCIEVYHYDPTTYCRPKWGEKCTATVPPLWSVRCVMVSDIERSENFDVKMAQFTMSHQNLNVMHKWVRTNMFMCNVKWVPSTYVNECKQPTPKQEIISNLNKPQETRTSMRWV